MPRNRPLRHRGAGVNGSVRPREPFCGHLGGGYEIVNVTHGQIRYDGYVIQGDGRGGVMDKVYADDRVETRHPEQDITKADAIAAWNNIVRSRPRLGKDPNEYIAIGIDGRGRAMELVAVMDDEGDWLVYHAFIPPQARMKRELGFERGNR